MVEEKQIPNCCQKDNQGKALKQGLIYGLIPHIGCIAFILFSLLGVTVAASLFRPLLEKSYFFYAMIALSLLFATLSALFYLRKQGGIKTVRDHKGYLGILYGSTILVMLVLYFVVFPLVFSISASATTTGTIISENNTSDKTLILNVAIPCSGHSGLIIGELQKLDGVKNVEYSPMSTFKVTYNPEKVSEKEILNLDIFKEYNAKVV